MILPPLVFPAQRFSPGFSFAGAYFSFRGEKKFQKPFFKRRLSSFLSVWLSEVEKSAESWRGSLPMGLGCKTFYACN